jgi:hypothetical protein
VLRELSHTSAASHIITVNAPHTVVGFCEFVESLKTNAFLDNSYDKQVEFLHTIKKRKDLVEPPASNALSSFHTVMWAKLPGTPHDATDAMFKPKEMRSLYPHAMPITWQEKFQDASKTLHKSTLFEIQDYMQQYSGKEDPL